MNLPKLLDSANLQILITAIVVGLLFTNTPVVTAQTIQCPLTSTQIADGYTEIDNTASVVGEDAGPVEDSVCVVVEPPLDPASITIAKTLTGESGSLANTAEEGEVLTYTITLSNAGDQAGTISVTETVPLGTTNMAGDSFPSCTAGAAAGTSCVNVSPSVPAAVGGTPGTATMTFVVVVDDPFTTSEITNIVVETGTTPPSCPAVTDARCVTIPTNNTNAVNDFNNTLIDIPVTGNLLTNDFDTQNDTQTVVGFEVPGLPGSYVSDTPVIVSGVGSTGTPVANAGTLVYDSVNTEYVFTPATGFAGDTDPVSYQVCDDKAPPACDTALLTITVIPEPDPINNNPPVANVDAVQTEVGTPIDINSASNDFDPDGNLVPSTANTDCTNGSTGCSKPTNGTVADNGDGTFTYTPDPGFVGEDSFVYEICDDGMPTVPVTPLCDTTTVTIITLSDIDNITNAADDANTTTEGTPVVTDVLANDKDPEDDTQTFNGLIDPVTDTQLGPLDVVVIPNVGTFTPQNTGGVANGLVTFTPVAGFTGPAEVPYEVCDDGLPIACDQATLRITVLPAGVGVVLDLKVLLQGALNVLDTYFFTTIMRDDLRIRDRAVGETVDFLPATEPYTALANFTHVGGGGGEAVADEAAVFADNGNDSIVDWVFVELRSETDAAVVVATRAGLVQRDGDVVDVDGISPLIFTQSVPSNFYVSVSHRNHIGVMTASAIALSATGTTVDFTLPTTDLWHVTSGFSFDGYEAFGIDTDIAGATAGSYGPSTAPADNDILALWAGNSNHEEGVNVAQSVVFAGQNNDVTPVFNIVDGAPENFFGLPTFVYNAYSEGDINLNGSTVFGGQNNDVDIIFNNIDQHPRNIFRIPTFVIQEQLPSRL